MKFIGVFLLGAFLTTASIWQPDLASAKKLAHDEHRLILLNFSGSDWCVPCIRMHKDIFDSPSFLEMAEKRLAMVNADFPRQKKNQLEKSVQKANDALADRYNPEGKFPYTLLLDADGNVIQSWDGYPKGGVEAFINQVEEICDARH